MAEDHDGRLRSIWQKSCVDRWLQAGGKPVVSNSRRGEPLSNTISQSKNCKRTGLTKMPVRHPLNIDNNQKDNHMGEMPMPRQTHGRDARATSG